MSGSKRALAMWGAQQLTRAGEPVPDSTIQAAGSGYATALASAKNTSTPSPQPQKGDTEEGEY